jgi:hypothetical protein
MSPEVLADYILACGIALALVVLLIRVAWRLTDKEKR